MYRALLVSCSPVEYRSCVCRCDRVCVCTPKNRQTHSSAVCIARISASPICWAPSSTMQNYKWLWDRSRHENVKVGSTLKPQKCVCQLLYCACVCLWWILFRWCSQIALSRNLTWYERSPQSQYKAIKSSGTSNGANRGFHKMITQLIKRRTATEVGIGGAFAKFCLE